MTMIGYARVSSSGQTLDAQLEQLGGAGCEAVFRETFTGARSDRPQLHKALEALGAGDTLVITRLDRLARVNARTTAEVTKISNGYQADIEIT